MKGVLVADGLGERAARPKRHGFRLSETWFERPPVDQAIEAFSRAGFEEVAVVVGHSEDVLWAYLADGARYGIAVYCLHNAQYPRGNATAIHAARAFVGGEPFVVSLSGYPLNANMLIRLQSQSCGAHRVCVNRQLRQHREGRGAVKVRMDEQGRVGQIGRRLKHWHALSTGTFLFQPDVFEHITALLLRGEDCSISALLQRMIAYGEDAYACDVSPLWESVQGADQLLVWTAPMLSVRFAGAMGGAVGN